MNGLNDKLFFIGLQDWVASVNTLSTEWYLFVIFKVKDLVLRGKKKKKKRRFSA